MSGPVVMPVAIVQLDNQKTGPARIGASVNHQDLGAGEPADVQGIGELQKVWTALSTYR